MKKARTSRILPPVTEPSSPHLLPSFDGEASGSDYQLFSDIEFNPFDMEPVNNGVLEADFEWNQGWDFSLVDQLFSTVTGPGNEVGPVPAFWDR